MMSNIIKKLITVFVLIFLTACSEKIKCPRVIVCDNKTTYCHLQNSKLIDSKWENHTDPMSFSEKTGDDKWYLRGAFFVRCHNNINFYPEENKKIAIHASIQKPWNVRYDFHKNDLLQEIKIIYNQIKIILLERNTLEIACSYESRDYPRTMQLTQKVKNLNGDGWTKKYAPGYYASWGGKSEILKKFFNILEGRYDMECTSGNPDKCMAIK